MNHAPSATAPHTLPQAPTAERIAAWHRLSYTRQSLGLAALLAAVTALQHVFALSNSPVVR